MLDCIIIGAGPAGVSSAVYLKRANKNILVIDNKESALLRADKIDNFYSYTNLSGDKLYKNGINQLKKLAIDIKISAVIDIQPIENGYEISLIDTKIATKNVILALGVNRDKPDIKDIDELLGKGVSYCAICDGFFYRKKDVIILGYTDYAISEADHLIDIANSVTIITNGNKPTFNKSSYLVYDKKITKLLVKDEMFDGVEFEDGQIINAKGLFVAYGTAGSNAFALKLGIEMNGKHLKVDKNMQTNCKGIYAVGDVNGTPYQIAKAVSDGMIASLNILQNK